MTKSKSNVPSRCVYGDFINILPPDYRVSLPNLLQRSRRGTFPPYIRLTTKFSPALFSVEDVVFWTEKTFGLHYPDVVIAMKKALGVESPKTKKGAR